MTQDPVSIPRTVLVTGANRGIGLETSRRLAEAGHTVLLTSRDAAHGRREADALAARGLHVLPRVLDVGAPESIASCARDLQKDGIDVDVLVNNAALYPSGNALETSPETLRETLDVNFTGAFLLCRAFIPAMIARGFGRVVNVSSGSGAFAEDLEGPAAYCISKVALNALTVKLAQVVPASVKVNAVCPGWVRTRMGGEGARRSVEKGAETVLWLATLPDDGPSGGFFRDRRPIQW